MRSGSRASPSPVPRTTTWESQTFSARVLGCWTLVIIGSVLIASQYLER
ncbi:Uncharacterised protein [Mycobacteroides abscessus subsp. abscessus]|nr:Uncharacterised protein [Mycobacteroides abscessus subsp. abscessus]SKU22661.1 Uncharacterised protein [Mycobacteroides abscessus subsp. abscessus]SKV06554.1 Uncharacterised protein [Mycobacteroides abscessus subsp. abscessus]